MNRRQYRYGNRARKDRNAQYRSIDRTLTTTKRNESYSKESDDYYRSRMNKSFHHCSTPRSRDTDRIAFCYWHCCIYGSSRTTCTDQYRTGLIGLISCQEKCACQKALCSRDTRRSKCDLYRQDRNTDHKPDDRTNSLV